MVLRLAVAIRAQNLKPDNCDIECSAGFLLRLDVIEKRRCLDRKYGVLRNR